MERIHLSEFKALMDMDVFPFGNLFRLQEFGFEALAWTPHVRYLFYHEEKDILLHHIEGDVIIWKNPTTEKIKEEVQEYPRGEVSNGESFDDRFTNSYRQEKIHPS